MIKKLENEFIGKGEVDGFIFKKKSENEFGYIYQVENNGFVHYEVFDKKITPICLDFEKKIFSETDFKEQYPKSNNFGDWAKTTRNIKDAIILLKNKTK